MTSLQRLEAALRVFGRDPARDAGSAAGRARCPVPSHGKGEGDRNPSLGYGQHPDGAGWVKCHANCSRAEILAALGLATRDTFPRADDQATSRRSPVVVVRIRPQAPSDTVQLAAIDSRYRAALSDRGRQHLAGLLGLTARSLLALGVGWDAGHCAWSFPMRDGDGRLVGFRLRACDGGKFALRGSREGLFLPADLPVGQRLIVTEGPTDAAALLEVGLLAVGRPSCTGAVAHVARLVHRLRPPEVVVAADRDEAGQRGATGLAQALLQHAPVRLVIPPAKDVREWLTRGGAVAADLVQLIEAAPLRRLRVQVAGARP